MTKKIEYPDRVAFDILNQSLPVESIDYKKLVDKYFLKRWYLYLGSIVFFVGATYLYLKTVQPSYEIKSQVVVDEGKSNSGYSEDLLNPKLELFKLSENVFNEIQLLTSFNLMKSTVEELNLGTHFYWDYGWSKKDGYKDFPISADTFALASVEYFGLPFEIVPKNYTHFALFQDTLVGTFRFDSLITNEYGTFRFRLNGSLPAASDPSIAVEFYDANTVTEGYLEELEATLTDRLSTTVDLSLKDPVPERGIDIMNCLFEKFEQSKIEENNRTALHTLDFIDGRINEISGKLRAAESSVERFKLNNQIASETNSDLDIILKNINDLAIEKESVTLQLEILGSMESALMSGGDDYELIPINISIVASPQIRDLVNLYNQLVLERRQLLVTGKPDNPVVKSINQKLKSLQSSIFSAFENLKNDLELKAQMLDAQFERESERIKGVPTKERALANRSRQKDLIEDLYIFLLQKKEETALAYSGVTSNIKVIDPPHSSLGPISPKKKLYYFASLLLGFAFPFVFVSAEQMFKDTIQTAEDLTNAFPGHLILGIINKDLSKKSSVVPQRERTMISDRFRYLRNNIHYHFPGDQKSMLVTSSVNGEGKSFIAVNLAASFASSGKKTILVGFDMYKSQITRYLKEDLYMEGLSNYLSSEVDAIDVIHASKQVSNLDFIAGGNNTEANPADLITNHQKLDSLFSFLRKNYEIIIIDTPPIGMVSDAILLNKYITFSLFILKSGKTNQAMIKSSKDLFDQEKLVSPALVLNGVQKSGVYGYN